MASPTVAARTESAVTTAANSSTVNFTQTTANAVLIFWATAQNIGVGSLSDGFVDLTLSGFSFNIIYKSALDGSEGGNVVITHGGGVNDKTASLAYNISGHDTTINPEFSTVATGTSTAPNPTTVTPTGGSKDYLWIAAFGQAGEEADDDTWCTAAPTNFTNLIQKTSGVGGAASTNCQTAGANFASTAASMDPAAFTTVQSLAWRAYVVAVHPAAPAVERVPFYRPMTQLLGH